MKACAAGLLEGKSALVVPARTAAATTGPDENPRQRRTLRRRPQRAALARGGVRPRHRGLPAGQPGRGHSCHRDSSSARPLSTGGADGCRCWPPATSTSRSRTCTTTCGRVRCPGRAHAGSSPAARGNRSGSSGTRGHLAGGPGGQARRRGGLPVGVDAARDTRRCAGHCGHRRPPLSPDRSARGGRADGQASNRRLLHRLLTCLDGSHDAGSGALRSRPQDSRRIPCEDSPEASVVGGAKQP